MQILELASFVRALEQAVIAARADGRTLVNLSLSPPALTGLAAALATLGWIADPGELVSMFVGLPLVFVPADDIQIAAVDDHARAYRLN